MDTIYQKEQQAISELREETEEEMLKLSYMNSADPAMPVIGMLTKDLVEEKFEIVDGCSEHLEPQYIRIFLGAKVIPISMYLPRSEMKKLMLQTNGICFPGGHCNIYETDEKGTKIESKFTKAGRQAIEIAIEINNEGTYYPAFGICLGFELFIAVIAKDIELVEKTHKCDDYCAVLQFTETAKASKLYNAFTDYQKKILQEQKISYNYHSYMTDYKKFMANQYLSEFFNVVSLSPCSDESFSFVSTIEGKKYPFYAFQHHPEWGVHNFYLIKLKTVENADTKAITKTAGDFFVAESKKNSNRFANLEDLKSRLICNAKTYKNPEKGYVYLFKS